MASAQTCISESVFSMCKEKKAAGKGKGYLKLLCSIVMILFLMLYACPRLEGVLGFKPIAQYIDERDINSNMYFYTEVEEFSEASIMMDNTRAYPPGVDR